MKTNCEICGSSDANHIYEDHTYCFSCSTYNGGQMNDTGYTSPIDGIGTLNSYSINSRGIPLSTVKHFNVVMDPITMSHYYPYTKNNKTIAYKERKHPKAFVTHGDFKNVELFGQQQATTGKNLGHN